MLPCCIYDQGGPGWGDHLVFCQFRHWWCLCCGDSVGDSFSLVNARHFRRLILTYVKPDHWYITTDKGKQGRTIRFQQKIGKYHISCWSDISMTVCNAQSSNPAITICGIFHPTVLGCVASHPGSGGVNGMTLSVEGGELATGSDDGGTDELIVVKDLHWGSTLIIRWPHVAKFMFIWAARSKFFPEEKG